jgi:hypothetical protein
MRIALVAAALTAAAGVSASAAAAAPHMLVGIDDEASTLYGNPVTAFATLKSLRAQVVRVNLYWGGNKWAVANKQPTEPTNPGDRAYDWALYDRLVEYANAHNIKVVFSILFTPSWANGGKGRTVAPTSSKALQDFAYAAAERYSGYWTPPAWQQDPTLGIGNAPLPAVKMWTAWNEPNNPVYLTPQWKRVGGKWEIWSAHEYVKICNAVYTGVHSLLISPERGPVPGEQVACGVTAPRGNNAPRSSRPSVDPLAFMRALKTYGLKRFDVYAHNPYYGSPRETPTTRPAKPSVALGNIDVLLTQLTKLWGAKHLWITEYGYQTKPQDKLFGVTYAKQAQYLTQAIAIARKNPRIDMLIWFLLKDEPQGGNWQSGLMTSTGVAKPSYSAFQKLFQ